MEASSLRNVSSPENRQIFVARQTTQCGHQRRCGIGGGRGTNGTAAAPSVLRTYLAHGRQTSTKNRVSRATARRATYIEADPTRDGWTTYGTTAKR